MTRYISLVLLLWCLPGPVPAQQKTDTFLRDMLSRAGNDTINRVLRDPATYRVQIIYTQINRDRENKPSFQHYYLNYDPGLYFNPASTVKLPLALLALEKVHKLRKKGIDKYTPVVFDSSYAGQKPLYQDPTAANGRPSLAHFIKRAFLISENDPYNRLYQFVGQQGISRGLHQKGYRRASIVRQFMGFSTDQNRHTNAVRFLNADGSTKYRQPAAYNTDSLDFSQVIKVGAAHVNPDDSLVLAPFDFSRHNKLTLGDLQQQLQSILFPASVPKKQRFRLAKDDYPFLYRYLSQYPSETPDPKYDTTLFFDSYVKFFFRNPSRRMPPSVRVFNKVGWAYGFLTDVSYVVDFQHQVEYMLAATVFVNSDGVLNDGQYDYDTIGHPFLYHLGQTIYHYELTRTRPRKPDLTDFRVPYEKRDPQDRRPSLRQVDN
jgi:hypothetical protein